MKTLPSTRLHRYLKLGILGATLFLLGRTLSAADRPVVGGPEQLAVDQLNLKSGVRLRGMVFGRSDSSITMLVSAKWLKEANAALYESSREKTIAGHQAALKEVIQRLEAVPATEKQPAFAAFLKMQLDAAKTELAAAEKFDPQLLWLFLASSDVQQIDLVGLAQRQMLAWAWVENLERPETRTAQEMFDELKNRAVSPVGWPTSLIERMPARTQPDDEWAARMAVAEHAFDQPLHFQGTDGVLLKAEAGAQADVASLLKQLFEQQVKSQFGDLLGGSRPAKPSQARTDAKMNNALKLAMQTATREQKRGFRVTRVEISDDLQASTVSTQFFAKLPNDSWQPIFRHSETADARQAPPEIEQRIQDDPQVKKVLEAARKLGVSADTQLKQAIRFGAATMIAQQLGDQEFAAFRDRLLVSLARPMSLVQPTEAAKRGTNAGK